ncbi:hypothetical protein FRC02_001943 [Tulasnella sp. 418]|nr:hypothetical protein FRC02_001943 [Tulasnella sp. 418]
MVQWNSTRTKVQLRLAVQRLRMLQEKQAALAKKARRDIATLIEKGRIETARLRVETMINEDIHIELLELLELYCELIIARFGILELSSREPDPAVSEGVCSIIHAAPRTELKELHVLREMLMHKFGREFSIAVMENRDSCVSERVMNKLAINTPSPELVDAYLVEIAKAYSVDWKPITKDDFKDDNEGGGGGGIQEKELEPPLLAEPSVKRDDATSPTAKLPDLPPTEEEQEKRPSRKDSQTKASTQGGDAEDDDFDVLVKRFAALKKR